MSGVVWSRWKSQSKRPGPDVIEAGKVDPGGRALQVALAEFNALRAEIAARTTTQGSLITLVVTAIGIVAGLVVKDDGDPRLLLILPFLVAAAGIHSSEQDRAIALLGTYIRDELWPHLGGLVDDESIPSWENVVSDFRNSGKHRKAKILWSSRLLSGVPGVLIFGFGSVVPLVVLPFVEGALDQAIYWVVWGLGVALTVMYAVLAPSAWLLAKPLSETLEGYGPGNPGP